MNFLSVSCQDAGNREFSSGQAKGTLIIIGGGDLSESLNKKIMEISGGLQIPIVIIPTADGRENYDENFGEAGILRKMGATNVTVLHTSDRNVANTEEFVKPLLNARLVMPRNDLGSEPVKRKCFNLYLNSALLTSSTSINNFAVLTTNYHG